MKSGNPVRLGDVRVVYGGPEFELWELLMGGQIHIGGLPSSEQLAEKAGIRPGMARVDLCCCTGAGMWFLVRLWRVCTGWTRRSRWWSRGARLDPCST